MINETCPGASRISDQNVVYVKGTLYWLAEQEQLWKIVSLDMNNAKFREEFISGQCVGATKFNLTRAYADLLAIFRVNFLGQQGGCVVKVYDENLTMVSTDLNDDRGENLLLQGFRNNGEALLLKISETGQMVSYDFATKQFNDFGFVGQRPSWTMARPFVKSLVLLNDSDVQTTSTAPVAGKKFM